MASKSSKQILPLLFGLIMVAALIMAIYSFNKSLQSASLDRARQDLLSELQSDVYDLMLLSGDATRGDPDALSALPAIGFSVASGKDTFIAISDELDADQIRRFGDQLQLLETNLQTIISNSESISFFVEQLTQLENQVPAMQQGYTQVVDALLASGASAEQVAEAQAQVWRTERAMANLRQILVGEADPAQAASVFRNDMLLFSQVLQAMLEGDALLGVAQVQSAEASALLLQIQSRWSEVSSSIEGLGEASTAVSASFEASDRILRTGVDILNTAQTFSVAVAALPQNLSKRPFGTAMVIYASAVFAVFGFLLGLLLYRRTRGNLTQQESENEQNQEAILRLLDEIADLAEGDLTVSATVTEDFTGAIADSINYAIEQLRELVASVAITAENVAGASNETRATAVRLSEASEHQASQISETTEAIAEVATNLTAVSKDAQELATVAESSVSVARNGNQVVQNTIDGMNNIREQIQDTAKRIKRLGESSQEIGDIVSLINEIADQTNILALNASIQAAMAGEAGRGFAVVADEVQSLAERAADATRQIETLVRAIQSDTNEAVASMEQTTSEVVTGAQLANSAGDALTEIQSTSENLARLILAISEAASQQSEQANRASRSMRVISDITEQTLAGSTESGRAIGELAEQALQLRASVAGFKLPETYLSAVASREEGPAGLDQDEVDTLAQHSALLDDEDLTLASGIYGDDELLAASQSFEADEYDTGLDEESEEAFAEAESEDLELDDDESSDLMSETLSIEDPQAEQSGQAAEFDEAELDADPLSELEVLEAMEEDDDEGDDDQSFDFDLDDLDVDDDDSDPQDKQG